MWDRWTHVGGDCMSARAPKRVWYVRGCVGGSMFLVPGRGVDGSARWAISRERAREFTDEAEAQRVAADVAGTVEAG